MNQTLPHRDLFQNMPSYVAIEDVILTKHSSAMTNYPDSLRMREMDEESIGTKIGPSQAKRLKEVRE